MVVLVHYGELALKGTNRPFFERLLRENISEIPSFAGCKFRNMGGGFLITNIECDEGYAGEKLKKVFGIANFSFVVEVRSDMEPIGEKAWELARGRSFSSFKIDARRSDKNLPFDSAEVNKRVGEFVRTRSGSRVDLEHPDLTCHIEIFKKSSFIYFEKISGAGGLPVGSSGKTLCLLSGGIDSPVAAWQMLKRGCEVEFVHFHSHPMTGRDSIENVKSIVAVLKSWGAKGKLTLVPLLEIQKELFKNLNTKEKEYLVLLYRYFMLRISDEIAEKNGAKALVTGDSLGQVASQTIPNLDALDKTAERIILRPLLGFDKKEAVDLARKIGTYEISIRAGDDCCSLFVPRHPKTSASFSDIQKLAKKVKPSLVKRAYNSAEELHI